MSGQIPHPRLDGTPAQGSERPESAGGAACNRMICIVSFDTNRARESSRAFVDLFYPPMASTNPGFSANVCLI